MENPRQHLRRRVYFGKHLGPRPVLVSFQALANANKLGLHILDINHSDLRPHCLVEKGIRPRPSPVGSGQRRLRSEARSSTVALLGIGLQKFVCRQQIFVVHLDRIIASDFVVGSEDFACALQVRSNVLLVLLLGQSADLLYLRPTVLLPLSPNLLLAFFNPWRTILYGINAHRRQDERIDGVVVRSRKVHVWLNILLVARQRIRDDGLFGLEIRFADVRRIFVALLQRGRAAEQKREDNGPGRKSKHVNISTRYLPAHRHAIGEGKDARISPPDKPNNWPAIGQ